MTGAHVLAVSANARHAASKDGQAKIRLAAGLGVVGDAIAVT